MPNWKTVESYQRLLAAMVATQELKLDYRKIASYYGEGATYDSIEGRFRIVRKDATKLKQEVDSGARPSAAPRGGTTQNIEQSDRTPRGNKLSTPRKQGRGGGAAGRGGSNSITPTPGPTSTKREKIITGRITKPSSTSPIKTMTNHQSLTLDTDGAWEINNNGPGTLTPTSLAANMKQESLSSHSSAAASVYEDPQGVTPGDSRANLMVGMDGGVGGWADMATFGGWSVGMQGYGGGEGTFAMEDGV